MLHAGPAFDCIAPRVEAAHLLRHQLGFYVRCIGVSSFCLLDLHLNTYMMFAQRLYVGLVYVLAFVSKTISAFCCKSHLAHQVKKPQQ